MKRGIRRDFGVREEESIAGIPTIPNADDSEMLSAIDEHFLDTVQIAHNSTHRSQGKSSYEEENVFARYNSRNEDS